MFNGSEDRKGRGGGSGALFGDSVPAVEIRFQSQALVYAHALLVDVGSPQKARRRFTGAYPFKQKQPFSWSHFWATWFDGGVRGELRFGAEAEGWDNSVCMRVFGRAKTSQCQRSQKQEHPREESFSGDVRAAAAGFYEGVKK